MSNTFMSLETVALEIVTGGTGRAPSSLKASGSSSLISSSGDASLNATLAGLQSSLKTLAEPKKNSCNTMMMFCMAMAMSNRPHQAPGVVYVGGGHRGYW